MRYNADSYDCIYSASGTVTENGVTKTVVVDLKHHACFSSIYHKIKYCENAKITYKLYLFKKNIPDRNYNLCTKEETRKILRCLQKTVPFSYKFTSDTYTTGEYSKDKAEFQVLNITIEGTYYQHLWITSMLRCFFEWPYNVAAKEACEMQSKIKKMEGFNLANQNWINLYLTIAAQLGSTSIHGVVDLGKHPKARTYKNWSKKLASVKSGWLIDKLRDGQALNGERININSANTYNEGIESRAAKYVAAYKDKLSWKK